ncbi:MAG: archease [Bryobacteraceae bacterium]|nr:archease [Bryobacteraceae bacterium]
MNGFEILEHTADTGFRVRARTLEDLFSRAAEALTAIALDPSQAQPRERREAACSGDALEERLVNWLNEILWLLDGERWVPARIESLHLEGDSVRAAVLGEPRDDQRHPPRIVVKAVTFHQLVIREQNGMWEAEVFLDI